MPEVKTYCFDLWRHTDQTGHPEPEIVSIAFGPPGDDPVCHPNGSTRFGSAGLITRELPAPIEAVAPVELPDSLRERGPG